MEQNCSDAETWHFSQLLLWDRVCAISVCGRALLKVSLRSLRCISSISAGQLLTYQLITPDILISKQSLSLWTLINFVGFGLFGGFLLVCFGFVVCCFFFFLNLNECEICLFWHTGSACPLLTIKDTHAVHQQECMLAWLVTLHSIQLAVPCSEISCVQ